MKLYFVAVILFGCASSMGKDTCTKVWAISTNYNKAESSFIDTACVDSALNLADSVYVGKDTLDSILSADLNINHAENFSVNQIVFQNTSFGKYFFSGDTINVYKIYWSKDDTEYNDFSSFFLYTKQYGVVYKSFRKRGKEFFRWQLLDLKYHGQKSISFKDFTNALLKDTMLFESAAGLPK